MEYEKAKEAAGKKALEFIRDGMRIGLGSGSTSAIFIRQLIQSGKKIEAVATSTDSEKLAKEGNIPLLRANEVPSLDLTVDGADEIDPQKRLIKGAGGALVREKILASMSKEMIVIADESKKVEHLGKRDLPVEIIPFGVASTRRLIETMGYKTILRKDPKGSVFVTDNSNWIIDLKIPSPLKDAEELQDRLLRIPGVVDTGLFLGLATKIIIGQEDGSAKVL